MSAKPRGHLRLNVELAGYAAAGTAFLLGAVHTVFGLPAWESWLERCVGALLLLNAAYETWIHSTRSGQDHHAALVLNLYKDGLDEFEAAVGSLGPRKLPKRMNILGAVLVKQGRGTEAEAAFRRAAELGYPAAMVNLGRQLACRGEPAEAEAWFRHAMRLGVPGAAEDLALLLRSLQQDEEADVVERMGVIAGGRRRRS